MGSSINMTREQRAALLDRIDVLNKVKALMLMPEIFMVTTKQLAEYFEETHSNIQKCYANHKEELQSNGAVTLTPKTLKDRLNGKKFQFVGSQTSQLVCIDDTYYFEISNRGSIFFPPRAILNMAMLLPKSRVAQEIRNQLLNIAEATQPQERIAAIEDEQDMLNSIGRAYASGDITAFAEATARYSGYLNRHLAAATEQISALNTEKAALNEVNAMLSEQALVWEPRRTLNALIRAIAAAAFDHKYSAAWDRFYRELKYRTGITITRRDSFRSGKPALDAVRDDEWPQLMKVIASLCYDYCVDVIHATNAETVRAYDLDTIETEFGVRKNHGTKVWKLQDAGNAASA